MWKLLLRTLSILRSVRGAAQIANSDRTNVASISRATSTATGPDLAVGNRSLPRRILSQVDETIPPGSSLRRLPMLSPDPEVFPFLRMYFRYCAVSLPRQLIYQWLRDVDVHWIRCVWVLYLAGLSISQREALAEVTGASLLQGDQLLELDYLYLFGLVHGFRARLLLDHHARARLHGRSGRSFCLRQLSVGRRAHLSWSVLLSHAFVGVASSHPPVCFFCGGAETLDPCCAIRCTPAE